MTGVKRCVPDSVAVSRMTQQWTGTLGGCRVILRCSLLDTAVNGSFQVFREKPYVAFKNLLVITENIWLIREKVVVLD